VAYVLGKRVVKDTEEFDINAYGITSPTRGGAVMFEQTFSSYDAAKSNLRNLLLTRKGERIMQPEFGSGIHSLLFEQADGNLETDLEETIIEAVNFWLPYININEIDIQMTDAMKDQNIAQMNIKFTVGNESDLNEITFTVQG
jgi:phage baseplate assembly protein W